MGKLHNYLISENIAIEPTSNVAHNHNLT